MSDLKGTINYLKALRKICKGYPNCIECPLCDNCTYHDTPALWTDADILSLIIYAEQAQKEGE